MQSVTVIWEHNTKARTKSFAVLNTWWSLGNGFLAGSSRKSHFYVREAKSTTQLHDPFFITPAGRILVDTRPFTYTTRQFWPTNRQFWCQSYMIPYMLSHSPRNLEFGYSRPIGTYTNSCQNTHNALWSCEREVNLPHTKDSLGVKKS